MLKRTFYRDKKICYTVFSRDYGKISLWGRQNKFGCYADMGALINCQVNTKKNINDASAIKIKQSINTSSLTYDDLFHFMQLLAMYDTLLAEGLPYLGLYQDYLGAISTLEQPEYNHLAIELLKLKIIKMAGIGNQEILSQQPAVEYIFHRIEGKKISLLPLQDFLSRGLLPSLKSTNTLLLNAYL